MAGVVKDSEKRGPVWSYISLAARSENPKETGSKRDRAGSGMSDGRERKSSDASSQRSRAGSKNALNAETEGPEALTMQESIMAAASREELPSVRWPALRILLELSWEESLKMSLIESNVAEPYPHSATVKCEFLSDSFST